jgi:hypothetical protein
MRNVLTVLIRKTERKKPLGKPMRGCEDNIKMNLEGMWWEDVY